MNRAWVRALLVAAAVVVLDQFVKELVRSALEPGEVREVTSFLDLVHVRNDGIAFGQFASGGALVIVIVLVALSALIYYFATHVNQPWVWLPTGLLLGGAIGNLIDRARLGAVTDFVKFPHWPAFNVADSAVTVGVIVLLIVIERAPHRDER